MYHCLIHCHKAYIQDKIENDYFSNSHDQYQENKVDWYITDVDSSLQDRLSRKVDAYIAKQSWPSHLNWNSNRELGEFVNY
jgi:hypothetical protein